MTTQMSANEPVTELIDYFPTNVEVDVFVSRDFIFTAWISLKPNTSSSASQVHILTK